MNRTNGPILLCVVTDEIQSSPEDFLFEPHWYLFKIYGLFSVQPLKP